MIKSNKSYLLLQQYHLPVSFFVGVYHCCHYSRCTQSHETKKYIIKSFFPEDTLHFVSYMNVKMMHPLQMIGPEIA